MKEKNKKNLSMAPVGFLGYSAQRCICKKGDFFPSRSNEAAITDFNLHSLSGKDELYYAFSTEDGLFLSSKVGAKIGNSNLLGELINLELHEWDSLIAFFQTNGFYFPLEGDVRTVYKAESLKNLTHRIQAMIQLIRARKSKRYDDMFNHVTYLLYSTITPPKFDPESISKQEKANCCAPLAFTRDLYNPNHYFEDVDDLRTDLDCEILELSDELLGSDTVAVNFYNDVKSRTEIPSLPGSSNDLFHNLFHMHCSSAKDPIIKLIADFYYHYQMENGIITSVVYGQKFAAPSAKMEAALAKIVSLVISEECNYRIESAHLTLNPDDLMLNWVVDSFLQAIYIAIIYHETTNTIYRKCKNPNCKHPYFVVKASVTKRQYCCDNCRNAANQQKYRSKIKLENRRMEDSDQ